MFGGFLVAGAGVTTILSRALEVQHMRVPRRASIVFVMLLIAGVVVIGALKAGSAWNQFTSSVPVSNSPTRFTTAGSNFRWVWWSRAWHAFTQHPAGGSGAGSFELTNLLDRTSYVDYATEPHDLPLQFLSETGLIGFVILVVGSGSLVYAAGRRRQGPELALALALPTYLLHSLVDIDWDFVAVSAPAFLVAGALAGRRSSLRRRVSPFAVLVAAGASFAVIVCLLLPWLGHRWSAQAEGDATPTRALATADRAHAADPLLIEPIWTEAENQPNDTAGNIAALALYRRASQMQAQNPYTWLFLGEFELSLDCLRLAYPALQRFTDLDDHDRPTLGADDKNRALAYVNSGKSDPASCKPYGD